MLRRPILRPRASPLTSTTPLKCIAHDDETASVQKAVVRAASYRVDIGPVDVVELAFKYAVKADQLIGRQPAAVTSQDAQECLERARQDGRVRAGTRRTDRQRLPCLQDIRPKRCPRGFQQRPETRFVFRRREPQHIRVRHHRPKYSRTSAQSGKIASNPS